MGFYGDTILPWFMDRDMSGPEMDAERKRVLDGVAGEVLEIGFGTGANLPHYPAGVEALSAIEPSGSMSRRAQERIAAWPGTLDLRTLAGERLPYEDGRFDTVVMTLTLCSVDDVAAVLGETRRVLRPGGKVHFWEHVAAEHARTRKWQDRLTPLHRAIGGNCHLNRDAEGAYRAAGFMIHDVDRFPVPAAPRPLRPLFPCIRGIAVKPA